LSFQNNDLLFFVVFGDAPKELFEKSSLGILKNFHTGPVQTSIFAQNQALKFLKVQKTFFKKFSG